MRSILFLFLFSASALTSQNLYKITLDLDHVVNDRVKVIINLPSVKVKKVKYIMPAVIPGSYAKKDYGRFISDLEAYTETGEKLKVKKKGPDIFIISNSKRKLRRIEYWVNDTWDAGKGLKTTEDSLNYIFQPGGTNIDEGKNFVVNHPGFFGYVDGYKMIPYEISVLKPSAFFGSTSLSIRHESPEKDIVSAPDYVRLVDGPIMYCVPDTASFNAGNAKINISVYSETGVVNASRISEYVKPLSLALARFFVQMPVNDYHFIMYFPEYGVRSDITSFGGFGALEHSYSSFYFLPELKDSAELKSMVLGVVSHEFLHILTPLNIHSEEIENFDFIDPHMSMHLWMYEGTTEYFANLVQVKHKLMSEEAFRNKMQEKIQRASDYPSVSFTEMSKKILDKQYKDMYNNVYEKGALIGFLLDIRLMELSQGKMNLRDVMMKLKEKYGPSKPFKDERLIDDIVNLSFPEIRQFFNDYVVSNEPLPYKKYLQKLGWDYYQDKVDSVNTYGSFELAFNEKDKTFFISKAGKNVFDLKAGDILLGVNGEEISIDNYEKTLDDLINVKPEKYIAIRLKRNEIINVTGRSYKGEVIRHNLILENPLPTYDQIQFRNRLLNKSAEK